MAMLRLWSKADDKLKHAIFIKDDFTFEQVQEKAATKMGYHGDFRLECGTKITDIDCLWHSANNRLAVYYDIVDNNTLSHVGGPHLPASQPVIDNGFDNIDARVDTPMPPCPQRVQTTRVVLSDEPEYLYKMNHGRRGQCLIISNTYFVGMAYRDGNSTDVANLMDTFKQLDFTVPPPIANVTASAMLQGILKAAEEDHTDSDCFVAAILTHGLRVKKTDNKTPGMDNQKEENENKIPKTDGEKEENMVEVVFGQDEQGITIDSLCAPLKDCKSLFGKPKIIIIQACRGTKEDQGIEMKEQFDACPVAEQQIRRVIPSCADFLFVYASPPGMKAVRDTEQGSWFIDVLCEQLKLRHNELDLVTLLTRVNHKMAYDKEMKQNKQKQVSSFVSTLTKDLYI